MKLLRFPIYPLLIAAFPVLSLYAHNCAYIRFVDFLTPFFLSVGFTVVVFAVTFLFMGTLRKAAFLASAIALLVFSYDYIFGLMWHEHIGSFVFNNHKNMGLVLGSFIVLIALVIRFLPIRFLTITRIINVVAITLIVLPVFSIVEYHFSNQRQSPSNDRSKPAHHENAAPDTIMPDIYYLIFDRYASAATLQKRFWLDNTPFENNLRKKGFYVVSQSTSNYPKTAYSLASSLKMDYIDELSVEWGGATNNWKPIYDKLQNFKVLDFLKRRGYRFVLAGSWWEPTRFNPRADQVINYRSIPEFFGVFYRSTAFYPFLSMAGIVDIRHNQWLRIKHEFKELGQVKRVDSRPVFVFAHLLIPHNPFVFDSNGSYIPYEKEMYRNQDSCYHAQLIYANRLIGELVDSLLQKNPKPVIILQADEGPHPRAYEQDENHYNWQTASTQELLEKFTIFNAIYLPKAADTSQLYPCMTPVNTFRTVLSLYCDTVMPVLADKNFVFRSTDQIYDFIEITHRINPTRCKKAFPE